jgi:protein-disulfide isomerase
MPRSSTVTTVCFALLLGACSTAAQRAQQGPTDTVATVDGTSVTLAEVDEVALARPAGDYGGMPLGQALYESRRAALEVLVGDRLIAREAAALDVEPATLIEQEITSQVAPPTEAEISSWYDANPGRVKDTTLEEVRQPIREFLTQQREMSARLAYLERLGEKMPVRIALEPPRVAVADAGRPVRGPAEAPIEIIEFSDFECPFCARAHPTVKQVLDEYGSQVRLVYRHYPLPNHPNARPAAEASLCAQEQDKFWQYHDYLFANSSRLTVADLKQHASNLGLNRTMFDACLDSGKFRAEVENDIAAGNQAGVSGTPAFFINGRPLSGAQPFEMFKRVIDEELTLRAASGP